MWSDGVGFNDGFENSLSLKFQDPNPVIDTCTKENIYVKIIITK